MTPQRPQPAPVFRLAKIGPLSERSHDLVEVRHHESWDRIALEVRDPDTGESEPGIVEVMLSAGAARALASELLAFADRLPQEPERP